MPPTSPDPVTHAISVELGLSIGEELRRTDKSLLAAGDLHGRPVVVKLLLDDDPFWYGKLRHEIGVYETFAAHPPPIRVPELVHTDGHRVLVLERLDGTPVDAERYPRRRLDDATIDAILGTTSRLNAWHAPPGAFAPVFDYPDRVDRYQKAGYLDEDDLRALSVLLGRCGPPQQVNHGDPLPSNLLLTPDGGCALLDWEFTGLFLPGFDLAMLHTVLLRTPNARARIDQLAASAGTAEPFLINLACVLTRELRIHQELADDDPLRAHRLALLEPAWQEARRRLRSAAGDR